MCYYLLFIFLIIWLCWNSESLNCAEETKDIQWIKQRQVSFEVMRKLLILKFTSPYVKAVQQLPRYVRFLLCIAAVIFVQDHRQMTLSKFQEVYQILANRIGLPRMDPQSFLEHLSILTCNVLFFFFFFFSFVFACLCGCRNRIC